MGEFRARVQAVVMEAQNQLLVGTSTFQASQKALELAKLQGKEEEEAKNSTEDKKKDTAREVTQVISSIKNVYGRCVSSMKFSPSSTLHRDATLQQMLEMNLDIIADRLIDLQGIFDDFKMYREDPTASSDLRGDASTIQTGLGSESQINGELSTYSGGVGSAANGGGALGGKSEGFHAKHLGSQSTPDLHGKPTGAPLPSYANASGKTKGGRPSSLHDH